MNVAFWVVIGSVAGILFGLFAGFFHKRAEKKLQLALFASLAAVECALAFWAPAAEWWIFLVALAVWVSFLALGLLIGAKIRDSNDFQEAMEERL